MVPENALESRTDPRMVVTPLLPDQTLTMLQSLHIDQNWQHVLDGLQEGFDVGAATTIPSSVMFPNHASSGLVSRSLLSTT